MPWFKVDDGFDMHAKTVRAGNGAIGLWARCGAYCARNLTDGFIATEVAALYGKPAEIRALLAAGLWAAAEGGYRMHDFHDYNPSAAAVRSDREAAKKRQQRARDKASTSRRDARRGDGVTHAEVQAPSRSPRPDPYPTATTHQSPYVASGDAREAADEPAGAEPGPVNGTTGALTALYAAGVPLSDHGRAHRAIAAALEHYDPDKVRRGIGVLIAEQRTCTVDTLRIAIHADDPPPAGAAPAGRRRTASEKADGWLTIGLDDGDERPTFTAITGGAS